LKSVLSNWGKIEEKFIDKIKLFYSLLKDYRLGVYTDIPWGTIASIVATLVYVLTPIDLISDFIPVVGYIDDVAVISLCFEFISADLETYKIWKEGQSKENTNR
jgi:uncharacterized membrane protein YkvA (DUF1232 family)